MSMTRFKLHKTAVDVNRAIRSLAEAATRRFPYYRRLMQSVGLDPRHISSPQALGSLPITSKSDLLSPMGISQLGGVRRHLWGSSVATSGTSGQLLFVRMSHWEASFRRYAYYEAMKQNARLSLPLPIAHVGAGLRDTQRRGLIGKTLLPVRTVHISRFLPVADQARQLICFPAEVVTGYPSSLELVARELIRRDVRYSTRLVVSRGEVLSEATRAILKQAFNGKTVDYYNSEEVGNIAYECPAHPGIMHVNTDCCVLEIVDSKGDPERLGEEGRVVVTNLFNHTTPFLRYDLGDISSLLSAGGSRCACGSMRPTIRSPLGRGDDYFLFPFDRRLSPREVEALVFDALRSLSDSGPAHTLGSPRYQIIQEKADTIRLIVVGPVACPDRLRQGIETALHALGLSASLVLQQVESIPALPSGKSRTVFSRVRGPIGLSRW